MRRLPILLLCGATATPAAAHDFWVQPQVFAAAVGTPVPFTIQVGHGTARQRWGASIDRVVRFDVITAKGITSRRSALQPPGGPQDGVLTFAAAGTQVVVLATTAIGNELPSIRFNDYARDEGLTPALAWRARNKQTGAPGRELYSRRAKMLVQVGNPGAAPQPQITRPAGLTLEIVPQRNPYTLSPADDLPVLILYEGKPLAGALVKLNNLDFDARPIESRLTGPDGTATFHPPRRGKWQMNVVWTKPITGNPKADFETIFSSLTFGFATPATPPG